MADNGPISGMFAMQNASLTPYPNAAQNLGAGYNPVHAIPGGIGRNTAPAGTSETVPPDFLDPDSETDNYGYSTEDSTSQLWGYGDETGTADRPPYNPTNASSEARQTTDTDGVPYPSWNRRQGGRTIRRVVRGAFATNTVKVTPVESPASGHVNKVFDPSPEDSESSDDTTVFVKTSSVQRDQTRAGSQSDGTASTFNQPIKSRIVGQRSYAAQQPGGYRLGEMFPRQQNGNAVRPWTTRQAGTGPVPWMNVNSASQNTALNRVVPDDPQTSIQDVGVAPASLVNGHAYYGYTDEDVTW